MAPIHDAWRVGIGAISLRLFVPESVGTGGFHRRFETLVYFITRDELSETRERFQDRA
jgi:hypothetical protein